MKQSISNTGSTVSFKMNGEMRTSTTTHPPKHHKSATATTAKYKYKPAAHLKQQQIPFKSMTREAGSTVSKFTSGALKPTPQYAAPAFGAVVTTKVATATSMPKQRTAAAAMNQTREVSAHELAMVALQHLKASIQKQVTLNCDLRYPPKTLAALRSMQAISKATAGATVAVSKGDQKPSAFSQPSDYGKSSAAVPGIGHPTVKDAVAVAEKDLIDLSMDDDSEPDGLGVAAADDANEMSDTSDDFSTSRMKRPYVENYSDGHESEGDGFGDFGAVPSRSRATARPQPNAKRPSKSSDPKSEVEDFVYLMDDDDDDVVGDDDYVVAGNEENDANAHDEENGVVQQDDDDEVEFVASISNSGVPSMPPPTPAVYTFEKFQAMWEEAEEDQKQSTEDIESSKLIRASNSEVSPTDSTGQATAQYGRIMPDATQKILDEYLHVDPSQNDVVVDIGCGIGNFVLQAAFVSGCEARGIELDLNRFAVATGVFEYDLCIQQHINLHLVRDNIAYKKGKTKFVHGCLEDEQHRAFLTQPTVLGAVIKAFCNNFGGVFAHRCAKNKQGLGHSIDDFIAGLFALMPPGSVLITLYELALKLPQDKMQACRVSRGLKGHDPKHASFYKFDTFVVGTSEDSVTWGSGTRDIIGYRYTRLDQGTDKAKFLCCNPCCQKAIDGEPIDATCVKEILLPNGNLVKRVVMNSCDECGIDEKSTRSCTRKVTQGKH